MDTTWSREPATTPTPPPTPPHAAHCPLNAHALPAMIDGSER